MSAIAPEDVDASPSAARPPVAYASICHHKLFTLGMFYLKVRGTCQHTTVQLLLAIVIPHTILKYISDHSCHRFNSTPEKIAIIHAIDLAQHQIK
jgi:hypothetical protein